MLTEQQQRFLLDAAPASVQTEKATGLPAAFTLAQAIFESGWGARIVGNNCFGIKPDHHGAGVQYFISHEYLNGTWEQKPEAFERYDSLVDCFADHARLITGGLPYTFAWAQFLTDGDVQGLVRRVCQVYGTDPNYTAKILSEMRSATVVNAIAVARQSALAIQP